MASKVAWSRQEAAILLDGYIEVLRGELPRSRIIKRVSADLRKMAVNNGIEIDDIFRNENGISFQMQSMESAYRGVTVMKPATRLFVEVVALYNDNREEYEILLKEARAVIDGKPNYKDSLSSWLTIALPSTPINALLASYNTIEKFCLKFKVLKAPLFETTDIDILKSVQKTVSQNKIFRVVNKKQLKMIDTAMVFLLKYIREDNLEKKVPAPVQDVSTPELPEKPVVIEKPPVEVESSASAPYVRTEQDRRLIAKYPLIYKRIFSALNEDKNVSTTIADLYDHINHIARCADIEDILDNVSWSKCKNKYYSFSEEIACHNEPVDVPEILPTSEIERADPQVNIVDFNAMGDYSYTRPVSCSYFKVKVPDLVSWTDLYVKLVATLYDDYSSVIPVGKSFTGLGRADFGNKEIAKTMVAPKPVYLQMYLETNLSATNIVSKLKALLDICNVDYDNVVVEYQKKSDNMTLPRITPVQKSTPRQGKIDSNSFIVFLRDHEGMAENTCRSYTSAICIAERFAKEHCFEHHRLYTPDWREAKATVDTLLSDPVFTEYNDQQHNRFRAAMKKLLLFLRTDTTAATIPGTVSVTVSPSVPQTIADEKYRNVLMRDFQKGFRLSSPIELRKFKRYYEEINGKALHDDDATIEHNISLCGIQFEDKVFVPQTMLGDDTRERLFAYIRKSFDEGKTTLYYQALFNEFSEDFLDYFIYNADMLKEYLSFMLGEDYFFDRSYLSKDANITTDPIDEIRTCLKEYAAPMTYDVIFENLPHIPQQKIKQILATNSEFVSNGRGEYFHVSAVHFSDEELDNIADIITAAIDEKEFLSGNELIDAVKSKYPYTYEKNDAFSMVGLRDALKYNLCRRFSFSGNIISKSGSCLTMSDVFADYCRSRNSFTIDELNVLASELGTVIYFDPVYENSLRVNHDRFVSKSRAHFLISDTDAALDCFCNDDYISIAKVTGFGLFPNAGFPWNEYLLEHYVATYSEKYLLLHTGFNANSCVGAIVKKSAGFENFDDCIVAILADSDAILKKQQALQFLCDEGFIARRNLSNIEELLIRATAQRNRKEAN